jgi:sugar lactone lactonase YvrE
MHGQTDGIALSPDGKTVYYTAFSRREIHAVSTDSLTDRELADEQVEKSVKKIANKTSANDGICCDAQGRIYTTDYEENAIHRFSRDASADQKGETIVQDERLLWPDAVWVRGDYLYITTNQLNRLPGLHKGKDLRQEPYALFRYPLPKP